MSATAHATNPTADSYRASPSLLSESLIEICAANGTAIGWTVAHDALRCWRTACSAVGLSGPQADPARVLAADMEDLRDFYDTLLADARLLDDTPTAPAAAGRWWDAVRGLRRTAQPLGEDRLDLVLAIGERFGDPGDTPRRRSPSAGAPDQSP